MFWLHSKFFQLHRNAPALADTASKWRLALALLLICIVHISMTKSFYNWDLVGYLGAAYTMRGYSDPHRRTYEDLAAAVPAGIMRGLVTSDYRATIAASPSEFTAAVRFYLVKPAYPALMLAVSAVTDLSLISASTWISRLAYILSALLLYFWLAGRPVGSMLAFLIAVCAASSEYMLDLARYNTPDALALLFTLSAWWCFERQRDTAAMAIIAASVAVRPDNVLLVVLLGWAMFRRAPSWKIAMLAACGIGLHMLFRWYADYPGWQAQFATSFFRGSIAAPSLADYLNIYLSLFLPTDVERALWIFVPLNLAALVVARRGANERLTQMLELNLAFTALHWLVYPGENERLLVSAFLVSIVGMVLAANFFYSNEKKSLDINRLR